MNKKIDKSLNTSLDFFKTLDAGLTGDKSNNPINISEEHVGNITNGRVVAAHGRQYVVQLNDGRFLPSFPRGKKSNVACGDFVQIMEIGNYQGVIENIQPRHSLFYRASEARQKLIAANVDLVIVVAAVEPDFSDDLIACALLAAESEEIDTLILLNKCDIAIPEEKLNNIHERLRIFTDIGYDVLEISAKTSQGLDELIPLLKGRTSVLVGQSGMGKSSLINRLIPGAQATTGEISRALNSGRHTTTNATLYRLNAEDKHNKSAIIDSPGLQEFGLGHLDREEVEFAFREFRPYLRQCRFRDCRHWQEPDCALLEAFENGEIHPKRFDLFRRLIQNKY